MKKLVLGTVVLAIVVGLSGCASNNKVSKTVNKKSYPKLENTNSITYLTQQEVKDLHSGHTAYGKNLKFKANIEVFYSPNGTYKGTIANGKKKISGTWFVKEDGTKCNKSNKLRCNKYYKENDYYIATRNGQKILKLKFK